MIANYAGILKSQGDHCYCCQGDEYKDNMVDNPLTFIPDYSSTNTLIGLLCKTCKVLISNEVKYSNSTSYISKLNHRIAYHLNHSNIIMVVKLQRDIDRYIRVINYTSKKFINNP